MELSEALPLLTENHTAVAITVGKSGKAQSTIVTTGMVDGQLSWVSRGRTIKVKNIERTGRATVTVIKLDNRRYATVEGPAVVHAWPEDTSAVAAHVTLLKDVYTSMGRAPKVSDEEFAQTMADEKRSVISVTPESVYGSLVQG